MPQTATQGDTERDVHRDIHRFLKHGTLPQLRLFEASVRLGSFSRAAHELHMAQPTASIQIKKLTETVGLPLFEQIGKRMYVTEAGQRLYAGCIDMFRTLQGLEETLRDMRRLECGRLRLAVTSPGKHFAPRLLAAFIERHPGVETTLHIDNRSAVAARLRHNEDDLYLFVDPPQDVDVVVQAVVANPLVVFARSDHALAGMRNIPFARLAGEPFLIREAGSGTRMAALKRFAEHGLTPRVRMELNSNETIREAILAGLGVSILSRYTLGSEPEPRKLVCLDVEGFPIESHWHLVYPVGKRLSAVAQAFIDFVRAEAKTIAHPGRVAAANPARPPLGADARAALA